MISLISQSAADSAGVWDELTAIGTVGAVIVALGLALVDLRRQRKSDRRRITERENQFAVEQLAKLAELAIKPMGEAEKNRARVILKLLRPDEATLIRALVGPEPEFPWTQRTKDVLQYWLDKYVDGVPYSDTDEFRSRLPTPVVHREIADNIYNRNRPRD